MKFKISVIPKFLTRLPSISKAKSDFHYSENNSWKAKKCYSCQIENSDEIIQILWNFFLICLFTTSHKANHKDSHKVSHTTSHKACFKGSEMSVTRPVIKSVTRLVTRQVTKPVARQVTRPVTRSVTMKVTRPSQDWS